MVCLCLFFYAFLIDLLKSPLFKGTAVYMCHKCCVLLEDFGFIYVEIGCLLATCVEVVTVI